MLLLKQTSAATANHTYPVQQRCQEKLQDASTQESTSAQDGFCAHLLRHSVAKPSYRIALSRAGSIPADVGKAVHLCAYTSTEVWHGQILALHACHMLRVASYRLKAHMHEEHLHIALRLANPGAAFSTDAPLQHPLPWRRYGQILAPCALPVVYRKARDVPARLADTLIGTFEVLREGWKAKIRKENTNSSHSGVK